jgi:hypothetical protein
VLTAGVVPAGLAGKRIDRVIEGGDGRVSANAMVTDAEHLPITGEAARVDPETLAHLDDVDPEASAGTGDPDPEQLADEPAGDDTRDDDADDPEAMTEGRDGER